MNYTTIEQSKKLLELGLNPESADMYYNNGSYKGEQDIHVRHEDDGYAPNYDIPCWSVGALLELITNHDDYEIVLRYFPFNKAWQCRFEHINVCRTVASETFIDTVFKMILWLKENKYI